MVRVRQKGVAATGSFRLPGGGSVTVTARSGHRGTFALHAGGAVTMAGVKGGSIGMEVGIDIAQILIHDDPPPKGNGTGHGRTFIGEMDAHATRYGGYGALRHNKYFSPTTIGAGPTSWTNSTSILKHLVDLHASLPAGRKAEVDNNPVICFQNYNPAEFNAHMTAIPAWMTKITYCYEQEVDRSGPSNSPAPVQDFLNVYADMNTQRAAHANGAKVHFLKCFTHGNQVRSQAAGFHTKDYHGIGHTWADLQTPHVTERTVASATTGQQFVRTYLGLDTYMPLEIVNQYMYIPSGQELFGAPNPWSSTIQPWIQQVADCGLPWCLPEWGITLPIHPDLGPYYLESELGRAYSGDLGSPGAAPGTRLTGDYPNGLRRQGRLSNHLDWCDANGCSWVNYWCANGTQGTPTKFYHLDQGGNDQAPLWIDHEFPGSITVLKARMTGVT